MRSYKVYICLLEMRKDYRKELVMEIARLPFHISLADTVSYATVVLNL